MYTVNLEAPDISAYRRGNTGVDYVTTLQSARAGPHLMVSALVHGNELCGAIALDFLLRHDVRPTRGTLTLAFMNVAAFARFDPSNPTGSRFVDEDFNRVWSEEVLVGAGDSVELRRAREVRPVVDAVDFLLDIHSMQACATPMMMCGALEKGLALGQSLGAPEHLIRDSGHVAGTRMRDYGPFADAGSTRNALLVECGQHWEPASAELAIQCALRFLQHFDAVDQEFLETHLDPRPATAQRIVDITAPVTIQTDTFRFAEDYSGMEVIERAGTVIGWDGDDEVRTPYDGCVLVMPSRRLRPGQTAVRLGRYVI